MSDALPSAMSFFDAQNLFHRAKDAFGHESPNFDPVKLHSALCQSKGWSAGQVLYYTGIPDRNIRPDARSEWDRRLLNLARSGVHCTTRPLRHSVGPNGEIISREKGIDVRIALDLVATARLRVWDVAVIFSEDQDLAEAVEDMRQICREQERPLEVWCAYPENPGGHIYRRIKGTRPFVMSEAFYNACLDPWDYRPKHLRSM